MKAIINIIIEAILGLIIVGIIWKISFSIGGFIHKRTKKIKFRGKGDVLDWSVYATLLAIIKNTLKRLSSNK